MKNTVIAIIGLVIWQIAINSRYRLTMSHRNNEF